MKIRVEHGDFVESEIILRCRELDDEVLETLALLRDHSAKLIGRKDGEIHILQPSDVYYAESVDGRTFLYTPDTVLETNQSLSAIHDGHEDAGLIRIGKSQLVNLYHVVKLKSLPNSRIEITIKSGERLIVSRHFIQNLKSKLGIRE